MPELLFNPPYSPTVLEVIAYFSCVSPVSARMSYWISSGSLYTCSSACFFHLNPVLGQPWEQSQNVLVAQKCTQIFASHCTQFSSHWDGLVFSWKIFSSNCGHQVLRSRRDALHPWQNRWLFLAAKSKRKSAKQPMPLTSLLKTDSLSLKENFMKCVILHLIHSLIKSVALRF